jgi:hypothetical protein
MVELAFPPTAHGRSPTRSDPRLLPHACFPRGDASTGGRRKSRFEVIVGAYLTQNTSWTNVEKALGNLAKSTASDRRAEFGERSSGSELEQLIRPSGYFRQKAQRLKTFRELSRCALWRFAGADVRIGLLRNSATNCSRSMALGRRRPTRFFFMPAIIRSLLWTLIRGAFWNGIGIVSSAAGYDEIRLLFEHALGGLGRGAPKQSFHPIT